MVYNAAKKRLTGTVIVSESLTVDPQHITFSQSANQVNSLTAPFCRFMRHVPISQIIEYQEDLKYYWRDGYGVPINYEQACVVIDDVIQHFT